MKSLNIISFAVAILLCSSILSVVAEEEGGAKRSPLLRRPNPRVGVGKTTTSTTPAAPEEGDLDEEEYDQLDEGVEGEKAEASSTTTSTEAPKKIGPIIRPFRSNEDLLNALKRRQTTAKKGHKVEKTTPKPAPEEDEEEEEPAPAAQKPSATNDRLGRRRFGRGSA